MSCCSADGEDGAGPGAEAGAEAGPLGSLREALAGSISSTLATLANCTAEDCSPDAVFG